MTELVYGSLFSGYEGLTMGAQAVLPGRTAWVSDIDKGSCKLLAHRLPDVPNLGDVARIDWTCIEPVDVVTAGFPCQPVSNAGKRLGDEDERWLWDEVVRAVRTLRPGLLLLENVRGLLTARSGRLFGRVLGSLADSGYDARWVGLRAADTGAPHNRFRVFIAAHPRGEAGIVGAGLRAGDSAGLGRGQSARSGGPTLLPTPRATDGTKGGPNQRGSSGDLMLPSAVASLLPTPTVQDGANNGGPSQHDRNSLPLNAAVTLLPTPAVNDMGEGKTPDAWDEWTAKMQARHGNGNGHGPSLAIEAQRLLPTPMVGSSSPAAHGQISGQYRDQMAEAFTRWGDYAPAIARWEDVLGRPAPEPTQLSTKGNPQLSPRFTEFMMGLPAGWITDVPGLTRNEMLKLCGNGVVPQQAEAALRVLLAASEVAA